MTNGEKGLRLYLIWFGLFSAVGLSFLIPIVLGDWLLWQPRNFPVEMMLSSLYFGMGVVMVAASRNPLAHQSLVDFLIIGNTLHAGIMVVYAENWRHLLLDAGAVGLLGILPLFFYPWGLRNFLRYGKGEAP